MDSFPSQITWRIFSTTISWAVIQRASAFVRTTVTSSATSDLYVRKPPYLQGRSVFVRTNGHFARAPTNPATSCTYDWTPPGPTTRRTAPHEPPICPCFRPDSPPVVRTTGAHKRPCASTAWVIAFVRTDGQYGNPSCLISLQSYVRLAYKAPYFRLDRFSYVRTLAFPTLAT